MPSVFDLLEKDSSEISQLAREKDLSGRGSMRKGEKIASLADEDLSPVEDVLTMKKTDDGDGLVGVAKKIGIDSPHSYTKAELQARIIRQKLGTSESEGSSNSNSEGGASDAADGSVGPMPPDKEDPERMPKGQSHFESAEERKSQINFHLQQAAEKAIENGMSYVVVESFRPKDSKEPLSIKRSYQKRHPDTMVVGEVTVPHYALPLETSDPSPVFRDSTS